MYPSFSENEPTVSISSKPPRQLPFVKMTSFRGRIVQAGEGYEVRSLLENHLRAAIGAILSKPLWWVSWQSANDEALEKWLEEIEEHVVHEAVLWTSKYWDVFHVNMHIPAQCARLDFFLIAALNRYCDRFDEYEDDDDDFEKCVPEAVRKMNVYLESYGQILWYFGLELFKNRLRAQPLEDFDRRELEIDVGSIRGVELSRDPVRHVRRGHVTCDAFGAWVRDVDKRARSSYVVDGLWHHIHKVVAELGAIRQCITDTLNQVITEHNLTDDVNVSEFISSGHIQETWMSDSVVPAEVKQKLANVEPALKDLLCPITRSSSQVLGLVDPSPYSCEFGITMAAPEHMLPSILSESSDLVALLEQMERVMFSGTKLVENEYREDAKYQWIPSDFAVDEDGHVRILSYINNLHPAKNGDMYLSIAPMFDKVLSCLANEDSPTSYMECPSFFHWQLYEVPHRTPVPDVLPLQPSCSTQYTLKGATVQVIVKVEEIHLTPENPSYFNGSWQTAGSDAEQIITVGVYYFGCENITEPKLSFHVAAKEPQYDDWREFNMAARYGVDIEERFVQYLGSAVPREGRCLVFPNTLQHKLQPFELVDKTYQVCARS